MSAGVILVLLALGCFAGAGHEDGAWKVTMIVAGSG